MNDFICQIGLYTEDGRVFEISYSARQMYAGLDNTIDVYAAGSERLLQ